MPVIVDSNGNLHEEISFDREDEFEKCVISLADRIFGQSTIYVDVKKRMHGNGIISIPDGYVVDLADPQEPRLFIVENEIVSHDPFKHIGIQMLRFATSFEDAKTLVRNFIMEEIAKNPESLKRLETGCAESSSRNIDNYLDQYRSGKADHNNRLWLLLNSEVWYRMYIEGRSVEELSELIG